MKSKISKSVPFQFCFLIFLSLFWKWGNGYSQNVVRNYSFEDTLSLPCSFTTIPSAFNSILRDWTNPSQATPDIFSTQVGQNCWTSQPNPPPGAVCWPGSQAPRTGNTMAGIYTHGHTNNTNYREYLQVRLTSPMRTGVQYVVGFYASLADCSLFATNNLGMHFHLTATNSGTNTNLVYVPQLNSTQVLTNSTAWTYITDTITINLPYEYLIIGNFFNTNATTVVPNNGSIHYLCGGGYYYIDDVSVRLLNNGVLRDTTICLGDSVELYSIYHPGMWWALSSQPNDTIGTFSYLPVAPTVQTSYIVQWPGGSDTATVYVTPGLPSNPGPITGPVNFCEGSPQNYSISPVSGATSYVWNLPPGWSGSSTSTNILVGTSPGPGTTLQVRAVNACGSSQPSDLVVTVNTLPNVQYNQTHAPFCTSDPGFVLSGGNPTGGIYSGTGVSNGSFYPAVAGVGTFNVSYTFIDTNNCSSSAASQFSVVLCSNLDLSKNEFIKEVFPNPFYDRIRILMNKNPEECSAELYDAKGIKVLGVRTQLFPDELQLNIPANLPESCYLLRIIFPDGNVFTRKLVRME